MLLDLLKRRRPQPTTARDKSGRRALVPRIRRSRLNYRVLQPVPVFRRKSFRMDLPLVMLENTADMRAVFAQMYLDRSGPGAEPQSLKYEGSHTPSAPHARVQLLGRVPA